MNYNLLFRRIHKWVALIVGIQLVLWTLSGLLMTYVPIEEVHGDHLWNKPTQFAPLKSEDVNYSAADIITRYEGQDVRNIHLFPRNGKVAYEVRLKGKSDYIDARTGNILAPVTEQQAITIAKEAYRWTGSYLSIEHVTDPDQYGEIRGRPLPIWKVNFDDDVATSLYISPDKARVITVRSDIWRQFDFFWMLHIMDYEDREDFNSLLLILAASLGLFASLSGLIMIFYAFSKKDFRWVRK